MAFAAGAAAVVLAVVGVGFLSSLPNQPSLGEPARDADGHANANARCPKPRSDGPAVDFRLDVAAVHPWTRCIEAQELADAGDPDYTWQVDPQLNDGLEGDWAEHVIEPGTQISERFLRDELGLGRVPVQPVRRYSRTSVGMTGLSSASCYLRCAPGAD